MQLFGMVIEPLSSTQANHFSVTIILYFCWFHGMRLLVYYCILYLLRYNVTAILFVIPMYKYGIKDFFFFFFYRQFSF